MLRLVTPRQRDAVRSAAMAAHWERKLNNPTYEEWLNGQRQVDRHSSL